MDREQKFYNSAVAAMWCFAGLLLCILIALVFSVVDATPKELEEQQFYNQCETACFPNGVHSANYNRCMCAADVFYQEVK